MYNLDDPATVRRNLVVCPEMTRIIQEFERNDEIGEQKHHEQYTKYQEDFKVPMFGLLGVAAIAIFVFQQSIPVIILMS